MANILDEHPDLIQAILSNNDNLSYGSIISVAAGPDGWQTAITSQGIEELQEFIANFRQSPEDWEALLHSIIDAPDTIQTVKDHKPR